ncbi:ATP-binding protein [Allokutzneria albata]|nr:LuxR C-terminal-related transcriptional regulator [Allokutzneria albata]
MTRRTGVLPAELSSFVNRHREKGALKRSLAASRLVTVVGVGGVGKTRLALRVAAEVRKAFDDGVWWVELSALQDADLLAQVVAEVLGVQDVTLRPMTEVLAEFLAQRRLLLVLDTCEHLVEPCAELVDRLLRAAPGLRVLATSRRPLRIDGENLYALRPLEARRGGRGEPAAGVQLFLDRARAASGSFSLAERDREVVARLCEYVDGIPLAIELAAVRARALSVRDIVKRLDDRFGLLTRGSPGGPARHATLQTAINWSHDLCSPAERSLWARASVFAGSFDLTAVGEVCFDDQLSASDVLELVSRLMNQSILVREERPCGVRYSMLDTLRAYGRDRLRQAGEEMPLLRRHRDYYLSLARQFDARWCGPDQIDQYERLGREHTNLRAAIDFCLKHRQEHLAGLELAAALRCYWFGCGFIREGRYYLDRALALNPAPSRTRATALWACAWLANAQGDPDAADTRAAPALRYAQQEDDTETAAWAVHLVGLAAMLRGDHLRGAALAEHAASLHRQGGDPGLGLIAARAVQAVSLAAAAEFDLAATVAENAQATCDQYGERWLRSYLDWVRALAEMGRGDPETAAAHARGALRFKRLLNDHAGMAATLDTLAAALGALGQAERAARIQGIALQVWRTVGRPQLGAPALVAAHHYCQQQARGTLGDAAYQAAFDNGLTLDLGAAIAYALEEQAPPPSSAPQQTGRAPLTRREWQVAELVAEGLTNQQIAARLVIAKRTADAHVHHILTKLDLDNRAHIAAWATEHRAPVADDNSR